MKLLLKRTLAIAVMTISVCSCRKDSIDPSVYYDFDRVMILCAAGFNNLSSDLSGNIKTIFGSKLPLKSSNKAVVIFVHTSKSDYDYSTLTSPYIIRVYSDWGGNTVTDTLATFPKESMMTDPAFLRKGLQLIKDSLKSVSYGLIYSSHSTGWLPEGYYDTKTGKSTMRLASAPGIPKTKSLGMECRVVEGETVTYETDITAFRDAIPMPLDYLIIDACLAGGIEVAYELKDKARHIAFSQAEILSSGMNYSNITEKLLGGDQADLAGFCKDYFEQYNKESGSRQTATISLVNTANLPHLSYVCNEIFNANRAGIKSVKADSVQRFDRLNNHVIFDLEDILVKAGTDSIRMAAFRLALDACIEYKASTKRILDLFPVNSFCGLSSYIPGQGDSTTLHTFYRTLAWNKDSGFVK